MTARTSLRKRAVLAAPLALAPLLAIADPSVTKPAAAPMAPTPSSTATGEQSDASQSPPVQSVAQAASNCTPHQAPSCPGIVHSVSTALRDSGPAPVEHVERAIGQGLKETPGAIRALGELARPLAMGLIALFVAAVGLFRPKTPADRK